MILKYYNNIAKYIKYNLLKIIWNNLNKQIKIIKILILKIQLILIKKIILKFLDVKIKQMKNNIN